MSVESQKRKDHKPLRPISQAGGMVSDDLPPLRNSAGRVEPEPVTFVNPNYQQPTVSENRASKSAAASADPKLQPRPGTREAKQAKTEEKDRKLLTRERWLVRNGHTLTFVGLYLFSILVLFRPYELIPGLGFLSASAFYFALATVIIYIPSQLVADGNLTTLSTDVKAVLAMALIALVTIPIAKDPKIAWDTFNDPFIKAVIIFVVLVNVVRTRRRLMTMMWLSFAIGIYLGYTALDLYMKGEFKVEEYRVAVDVGGLFGNPNDMALHFVMMTPLVITLGIAAKNKLMRVVYIGSATLFVAANMVTFSRGGFLGLIAAGAVLAWKLGRKYRLNVTIASIVVGGVAMIASPGNYGLRMLSIFIPGLDAVGSSDQRRELLERSLLVTARNPWGIGIGNFPIVGIHEHQTHNAFTQVSSELGILGLAAYLVFIISPFRKLGAIERTLFKADTLDWYYYLSIGLQASIVGYLVTSFFASVAYNWFIYYLIAYAVAFRRIYNVERGPLAESPPAIAIQPIEAT